MDVVFVGVGGTRQAEWRLQTFTFVPGQPTNVPVELGLRLVEQDAYDEYEEPVVEVVEEEPVSWDAGKSNTADSKAKD